MVSEKRAALASQRRAIELLEAELKGMESILALIPQTPLPAGEPSAVLSHSANGGGARPSGGRQPGAISNKWKRHLLALDDAKIEFGLDDIIEIVADREGRNMRPSEVKRIFDKYVEQGHVVESETGYFIPNNVVQRFKASLKDAGDDITDEEDAALGNAKANHDTESLNSKTVRDLDDDIQLPITKSSTAPLDLDDDIPF